MLTSSPKGAKDLRAGRRARPRGAAREEPPSSPPQTPICTPPESLSLSSKLTALWKLTKWSPPFLQERLARRREERGMTAAAFPPPCIKQQYSVLLRAQVPL